MIQITGERKRPKVFDELKCDASAVHIERMSDGHIWMAISLPSGESIDLNFKSGILGLFENRIYVKDWEAVKTLNSLREKQ